MKSFFGLLGAFVVGLCVGMTSMTYCPYLSKFVCQAQCQANNCCVQKKSCCTDGCCPCDAGCCKRSAHRHHHNCKGCKCGCDHTGKCACGATCPCDCGCGTTGNCACNKSNTPAPVAPCPKK